LVQDVEMGSFANGINIFQSVNITVEGSQVTAKRDSIYALDSRSIFVLNCQVKETDPFPYPSAIYYYNVSGGKITGNFLPNTTITIRFGSQLEIRNNTITGRTETSSSTSRFGIEVDWSTELTIIGNEMEDDGIILQKTFTNPRTDKPEYYAHEINDNSVAGRPIYYYRDQSGITVPDDAGQVILVNCNNMTLQELNISGKYHAVTLSRTSNSTIRNCHFQSNAVGVRLIVSHNNRIEGCEFLEKGGLYQEYSNNTIIMSNVFSGPGSYGAFYTGIRLSRGRGSEIRNNCCTGVGNGILIWLSTDALITGNTITRTWDAGIEVLQSIEHNTIIRLNNISGNLRFGIKYDDYYEAGTLDARYNWWGDPSGPFHPLKNPNGTGDKVSDFVDFSPWQTEENPVNWSYGEPEGTKKESDEKSSATFGLYILLFALILVLFLLVVVVRLPDERFSKTRIPPQEAEMIEPPTSPPTENQQLPPLRRRVRACDSQETYQVHLPLLREKDRVQVDGDYQGPLGCLVVLREYVKLLFKFIVIFCCGKRMRILQGSICSRWQGRKLSRAHHKILLAVCRLVGVGGVGGMVKVSAFPGFWGFYGKNGGLTALMGIPSKGINRGARCHCYQ